MPPWAIVTTSFVGSTPTGGLPRSRSIAVMRGRGCGHGLSAPVTLFGAWRDAEDPVGAREVFLKLAQGFSQATSSEIQLIAADVSGDLAYTVQREITSTIVNGEPREYVLRVTQVYRRENGNWKVIHRHGDEVLDAERGP